MGFVLRHPVSVVLVAVSLLTTAAFFAFARPQYEPRYESEMIDFPKQDYYSADLIREAFAAEGILLHERSSFHGMLTLSNDSGPLHADALQVVIGPRTGQGSWGPKLEPYDERFGNVLVTYGGDDERLLTQIEAAVSAVR